MNWRHDSEFAAAPDNAKWVARFPSSGSRFKADPAALAPADAATPLDELLACADPRAIRFHTHPPKAHRRP